MTANVNAGALDQRITIDAPNTVQDTNGEVLAGFTAIASVWARVIPTTARERMNGDQILANIDARIHVRYSALVAGIGAKHRIRHGSTIYSVIGPPADVGSRKVFLEILCRAGDNQG